ncbi:MAG: hypothetical protein CMI60_03235 [Parvibaculum sp.]|nr:hypothetical protein [Parvibaculum sp.]
MVKCETVLFNPLNARTVRLTGGTKAINPHVFDAEIVSLEMPADVVISTGETISIKNRKYKVNFIDKLYKGNVLIYDLHVAKPNKSNIFILPMLSGERNLYFYNTHLVNVFIGTVQQKECIALLYRWSKDPLFLKFEAAIKQFRSYIDMEDHDEYVLYLFNIPLGQKQNYKKFINGKYSELNTKYKTQLLKFHGMNIDSQIGQILFKSEKRKHRLETMLGCILSDEAELYSIIDPKKELFNPKNYL